MHAAIGVLGLALVVGCGTVLKVTEKPLGADELARLRAGASVLQCREQQSQEFALFLVCPAKNESLGVSAIDGKLALTCNDLWPRNCKRLHKRLLEAGAPATPATKAPR